MDVELGTIEEPSRSVVACRNHELSSTDGGVLTGQDLVSVTTAERKAAAQREAEAIARSEMVRRRLRLGNLTPEQEVNVERLLISTANRISEVLTLMDSWPNP